MKGAKTETRSPASRLGEGVALARTIDLEVVQAEIVTISRRRPATLLGTGAVHLLGRIIRDFEIDLAVINAALTPVQQRNLERAWKTKVIDRTGLILEIFGARAQTKEGQMQVELAALTYQRSRLVRSWTHLERQRGALGFIGGPGESQLEIDRRLISDRIAKLRRQLGRVRSRRDLHRHSRRRVPTPVVALVGYTNAGKSSLFNRLTSTKVFAHNTLFSTLDPTMRAFTLPSGNKAILSDTVGFISELPTTLVAAFRATLEEVLAADLILHVRDVAHPESEAQLADVEAVLVELGLDIVSDHAPLQVLNKIDLLDTESCVRLQNLAKRNLDMVPVSAATGEGCPALLESIAGRLESGHDVVEVEISLSEGATIAWLYRKGHVLERRDDEHVAHVRVRLAAPDRARFARRINVEH